MGQRPDYEIHLTLIGKLNVIAALVHQHSAIQEHFNNQPNASAHLPAAVHVLIKCQPELLSTHGFLAHFRRNSKLRCCDIAYLMP